MYFYSGLLLNKYFLPVRQYLFYAGDGNQSINNSLQMFDAVSFQYFLFDFRRIAYQDLLTHPAVAVFAVLANFGNQSNEKAIETIVGAIKQKTPDPLALSRYAVQLQILSELRNFGSIVDKIEDFMLSDIKVEDTSLYKKGEKVGIEKGVLFTALNLLQEGMSLEFINKVTGISIEALKKLQQQNKS